MAADAAVVDFRAQHQLSMLGHAHLEQSQQAAAQRWKTALNELSASNNDEAALPHR